MSKVNSQYPGPFKETTNWN